MKAGGVLRLTDRVGLSQEESWGEEDEQGGPQKVSRPAGHLVVSFLVGREQIKFDKII